MAKDPSSFIDSGRFLHSLERRSKDEIISMIARVIEQNPSLINEFSIEEGEKSRVNIDAISEKIGWIVHGELDYYHIGDAIEGLEEIKNIADRLREEGSYKDASEIYFALVKGSVTAYDEGADDSDGSLGDFVSGCIKDFNKCMEQIDALSYKNRFLERILDVVESEDYGLETSEMLYNVLTGENVQRVEEYLLEKLRERRKVASDSSYRYHKEKTLRILNDLYEKLGKHEERLRLARYELDDKEDYARLAKVLQEEKRFEEALDAVKKGLALPGDAHNLNELYFDIARTLLRQKPELIDFNISLNAALDMMSGYFDNEKYKAAKDMFEGIGKLEDFKSAVQKSLKNRDSAVAALLHDGEIKTAIDTIHTEPEISPQIMILVSKAALDKGMKEESGILTGMVLEQGWTGDKPPLKELLKAMVDVSDTNALQDLCDRILRKGGRGAALILIPHLLKKSPELSALLVKNFMRDVPVEMVVKVAREVAKPDEGAALCRLRINEDILQSHVHYDKAVYLLSAVRGIYAGNEVRWLEFIRRFAAENKGKKKLIERVRKEFGVVL